MNIRIALKQQNPKTRLRRLGYAPYTNKQGKESFVRRLHGGEFPRFHLYIASQSEALLECTLHIDQTAPVYSKGPAHRGEYDTPAVAEEKKRLEL